MPSTHDKEKPWDLPDIDKWRVEPWKPEDNVGGTLLEESSFATLFPKCATFSSVVPYSNNAILDTVSSI